MIDAGAVDGKDVRFVNYFGGLAVIAAVRVIGIIFSRELRWHFVGRGGQIVTFLGNIVIFDVALGRSGNAALIMRVRVWLVTNRMLGVRDGNVCWQGRRAVARRSR